MDTPLLYPIYSDTFILYLIHVMDNANTSTEKPQSFRNINFLLNSYKTGGDVGTRVAFCCVVRRNKLACLQVYAI